MSLSCTISEISRDIGQKLPFEPTPPLFGSPVGVTPLEFHLVFGTRKLESPWAIVYGVVYVILCLAVFGTVPASDRQTGR